MIWLVAALTVAVALLAFLVLGVLRSHAEVLAALNGAVSSQGGAAGEGVPMPEGVLPPPDGVSDAELDVLNGQDMDLRAVEISVVAGPEAFFLIAFLSTTCLTCMDIWRDVIAGGEEGGVIDAGAGGRAAVAIALKGRELENLGKARALADETPVPVVFSQEAWDRLEIPGSPYFALLERRTGRIVGAGSAQTWSQIVSLASDGMLELSVHLGTGRSSGYRGIIAREDDELRRAGIEAGHPSLTAPITIVENETDHSLK
jgi:hypothetical protein